MRIIKKGKIPGERKFVTTCDNCKTKFEFLQQEGKIQHDQRDGDWIEVKCPLCHERIIVDYNK